MAHLSTPLFELLQVALESHRFALKIDQDNPDLLLYAWSTCREDDITDICSNTAQVLTSLAENLSEGRAPVNDRRSGALRLFQEALELFQRCLNVQEYKFTQAQENAAQEAPFPSDADNTDVAASSGNESNASEEEVWAAVEEPITTDTLLDTTIGQLDTLTEICSLGSSHNRNDLAWIEEYYRTELQGKIDSYNNESDRKHEVALSKANFISAISDAAFRAGKLDRLTYERELTAAFSHHDLDLNKDPQGLCDKADAHLSFNSSVQQEEQANDLAQTGSICWKHITKALDSLTAASKLPDAQNLPRIHLRRGDCELLRLFLGEAHLRYDLAIKSASTLLKNAEVYFRGAAALAKSSEDAADELKEAEVKEAIVMALADDPQRLSLLIKAQWKEVGAIVKEMKDEGLLGDEALQKIEVLFGPQFG